MSAGRRKDKPDPAPPERTSPESSEEALLTSEDLFGDLVDRPADPSARPAPPDRKGPIKIQVSEPGKAAKPARPPPAVSATSEELAALLDAISGPGGGAPQSQERVAAETPPEPLLPAAPEPPPEPAVDGLGSLLDGVVAPGSTASGLAEPVPTSASPRRGELEPAEDLLEGILEPAPGPLASLEADLLGERPQPASRAATKFEATHPVTPPRAGGLDLASLAEGALAGSDPTTPPAPVSSSSDVEKALEAPATPPQPLAPGENAYGPYTLLERAAVGGMAEVFKAKRSGVEGFEKVVAVKRILSHLSDNKEFVDMFIDEAKMVAGLTHPNIVQIFDLGRIERTYYIAMEYVHGRDLRSIQRRARERGLRIPLDLAVLIVTKVCSALEYAHRKRDDKGRAMKIVHRDVSPQNILISFEGEVKLTDFGIAKAATKASTTERGALRGKLLYMSPEQAWGKPMDRRSDLFSLGIILYELLTEQKPFLSSSEVSILEMVRQCQVAPPSTPNPRIPENLEKVVMRALEKDPDQRYQDAGEMHRDLDRILHERKPPTASELARFMEVLFDQDERGDAVADEPTPGGNRSAGARLEVELDTPPTGSAADNDAPTDPRGPQDPMSIQKLLKRFGIK